LRGHNFPFFSTPIIYGPNGDLQCREPRRQCRYFQQQTPSCRTFLEELLARYSFFLFDESVTAFGFVLRSQRSDIDLAPGGDHGI
jgi:hypothetical protein